LVGLPVERSFVWGPAVVATRLDALAALRDRERVESEVSPLVESGAYVKPFADRALGIVRGDDRLLQQADERFRALGLEWHRAQTERLVRGVERV
jgi:ABC-type taurine transport system substrate-binding protein